MLCGKPMIVPLCTDKGAEAIYAATRIGGESVRVRRLPARVKAFPARV